MKKVLLIVSVAACASCLVGCKSAAKLRDIELRGMYLNGYSEVLALGYGRLTSVPGDKEALAAHYEEDSSWLHPAEKTHKIDIFLVGRNSAAASPKIIEDICKAFAEVVPTASKPGSSSCAVSPLSVLKSAAESRKACSVAGAEASADCSDCTPEKE